MTKRRRLRSPVGVPAGAGTVLLGALLVLWGAKFRATDEQYGRDGVTTTAVVTDKGRDLRATGYRMGPPRRSDYHYWVTYRFTDESGASFDGRGSLRGREWDSCHRGGALPVEYLRGDPAQSRPAAWSGRRTDVRIITLLVLGAVLVVAGAVVLAVNLGRRPRST